MRALSVHRDLNGRSGFTLIELIVVVVIIGIASVIAVPMMSTAADLQVRSAANRTAADLDYAKNLAITHQKPFSVVFDTANARYRIIDTLADAVVDHPVRGGQFVTDFRKERSLSRVAITQADFDGNAAKAVTFNYLGSPFSGKGTAAALNSGRIALHADAFTLYVNVEPVTGYVTITGN